MNWKTLSKNEKVMIVLIVVILVAIIFRWSPIWEGIKEGFAPYIKKLHLNS